MASSSSPLTNFCPPAFFLATLSLSPLWKFQECCVAQFRVATVGRGPGRTQRNVIGFGRKKKRSWLLRRKKERLLRVYVRSWEERLSPDFWFIDWLLRRERPQSTDTSLFFHIWIVVVVIEFWPFFCRNLQCYRCAVMHIKHPNVLQYKESKH